MIENKHLQNVVFAFLITLGMNALDVSYHMLTHTAVHLNYVLIKFTIIFTTIFLIAELIGKSYREGIVTSILGPIMFYLYYRMATSTLNRSVFTLDENVGYIFLHALFLWFVYWLMYSYVMGNKNELARGTVCKIWCSILALVGVVYTFVPYRYINAYGISFELGKTWTPFLGILALIVVVIHVAHHFHKQPEPPIKRWKNTAFAMVIALTALCMDVMYQMFSKGFVTLQAGEIFFDNFWYLFANFIIIFTVVYMVHHLISRHAAWGVGASIVAGGMIVLFHMLSTIITPTIYAMIPHILFVFVPYMLAHALWRERIE